MTANNGNGRTLQLVSVAIAAIAIVLSTVLINGQTNARIDATRAELLAEIRSVRDSINDLR